MGFKLNLYDPCVANCEIDGKICSVTWYIDDTKISHEDLKVVTKIIEQLESEFEKMTVKRGKEHTPVGMDIELCHNKTVKINMKQYL